MSAAPRSVGILGGMGPAAGADFVRLFVHACMQAMRDDGQAVSDQAFPEHWLAQVPVPDRTRALHAQGPDADAPLPAMAGALERLQGLGACAVAMACNTAHAWHERLQARFPRIELLHIATEVAAHLQGLGAGAAVLLATQGTYRTGLYDEALDRAGIRCHLPSEPEREALMDGIYQGVKAGDIDHARERFIHVARQVLARHGDVPLIMGCTEIPLALEGAPQAASWTLVNPTGVLAQALAARAYGRNGPSLPGAGRCGPPATPDGKKR